VNRMARRANSRRMSPSRRTISRQPSGLISCTQPSPGPRPARLDETVGANNEHGLKIADLVVDPAYQRPIIGKGRQNVDRIARTFSWSCFAPVVVSPVEGGKFAIIDGQHRTTSAALVGFESVPCQIVIAAREEQAAAFKAINGTTTPISQMAFEW
jgi:hypothetical protein